MTSLNEAEYWLLDLVITISFPIYRLTHPDLGLIANRKVHGLSYSDLLDTLHKLFQDGYLICFEYPDDETRIEVVPTYLEIDAALKSQDRKTQYSLTSKGGSAWEALSSPDWDWFVLDSFNLRTDEIQMEASSLQIAERYLLLTPYWYQFEIFPESAKFQVLRPWEVTYWKTLPQGYKISMKTMDSSQIKLQQDMSSEEREFIYKVRNWHINPFENPQ
jgi:hypothetical protein